MLAFVNPPAVPILMTFFIGFFEGPQIGHYINIFTVILNIVLTLRFLKKNKSNHLFDPFTSMPKNNTENKVISITKKIGKKKFFKKLV